MIATDEYLGSAIGAIVARRLGVPGPDPAALLRTQNKYEARLAMARIVPEATPRFALVDAEAPGASCDLGYPCFVKPVRGSFSILARPVANREEIERHCRRGWLARWLLRKAVRPWERLAGEYAGLNGSARCFLAEELLRGQLVTVEGFVQEGRFHPIGVVDSILHPGTIAFERFELPSRLPAPVQARMEALAGRVLIGLGLGDGVFNVEMFYDGERDRISVVEVNPRIAYQFADLHEKVDGVNTYDLVAAIAAGEPARFERGRGPHAIAASFVLRTFAGRRIAAMPSRDAVAALRRRHPDARIRLYGHRGRRLWLDMALLGSYRYGLIHLGAATRADLFARFDDLKTALAFRFA